MCSSLNRSRPRVRFTRASTTGTGAGCIHRDFDVIVCRTFRCEPHDAGRRDDTRNAVAFGLQDLRHLLHHGRDHAARAVVPRPGSPPGSRPCARRRPSAPARCCRAHVCGRSIFPCAAAYQIGRSHTAPIARSRAISAVIQAEIAGQHVVGVLTQRRRRPADGAGRVRQLHRQPELLDRAGRRVTDGFDHGAVEQLGIAQHLANVAHGPGGHARRGSAWRSSRRGSADRKTAASAGRSCIVVPDASGVGEKRGIARELADAGTLAERPRTARRGRRPARTRRPRPRRCRMGRWRGGGCPSAAAAHPS